MRYIICLLFLLNGIVSQTQPISFLDKIEQDFNVELALSPELIPLLDSVQSSGQIFKDLDHFLSSLLRERNISYQIVDSDKIMLRRESEPLKNEGIEYSGLIINDQKETLPFATIVVHPEGNVVNCDENGKFKFYSAVPEGSIEIHYIGHKTTEVTKELLRNGQSSIHLLSDPVTLNTVTIYIPAKNLSLNKDFSIQYHQFKRIPKEQWSWWNVHKVMERFTNYTSLSSEEGILIRGSSATNTVTWMDGIPVYYPYHFYNLFGPYNPLYFTQAVIYRNNFPIEYGGRIDGLVKVNSENDKSTHFWFDTDLLQTSGAIELNLSPTFQFNAGARFSHTKLIEPSLSDSTIYNFTRPGGQMDSDDEYTSIQQPAFKFYDYNAGLKWKTSPSSTIEANYFQSKDQLIQTSRNTLTLGIQNRIEFDQRFINRDSWWQRGASIISTSKIGNATSLNLHGFYSEYKRSSDFEMKITEQRPMGQQTFEGNGKQTNSIQSYGLKAIFNTRLKGSNSLLYGLDLTRHEIELNAIENSQSYTQNDQQEVETTLFGEYTWKPIDRVILKGGIRNTWLLKQSQYYFLPQVSATFQIAKNISITGAWSENIQIVRTLTSEDRFGREIPLIILSDPALDYPVLKSSKYMLGTSFTTQDFQLNVETYYKRNRGMARLRPLQPDPSYQNGMSPDNFYDLFIGEGWAAGVEISGTYTVNNFETTLFYNLGRIAEQYPFLFRGEYFSPQEDRRHQLKLSLSYRLQKFSFYSFTTYKTGAPYLSFSMLEGGPGVGMAFQNTSFQRLPSYFSLDAGINYDFKWNKVLFQTGVSVYNVTQHKNIESIRHVGRLPGMENRNVILTQQTQLPGRTFNVHFRMFI